MESIIASVIPVTALVAPGPEVTSTTPALPVERAYPSAAWVAACQHQALEQPVQLFAKAIELELGTGERHNWGESLEQIVTAIQTVLSGLK